MISMKMNYTGNTNEYFEVRSAISRFSDEIDTDIKDLFSIILFKENRVSETGIKAFLDAG